MGEWVRLCAAAEAPGVGQVIEAEARGRAICLANLNGSLAAVDNVCPHREGPLGQGWIEGESVICPWHSWAFDLHTGASTYPEGEQVAVFPVRIEQDEVQVELG
jgi:nitrite reductase (NADH) small subunit